MTDLIDQFRIATIAVWTPVTLISAIVAGIGFGFAVLGGYAANPLYVSQFVTPRQLSALTAFLASLAGIVFYVSQSVAAGADHDAGWPRVAARLALWLVFSVCTGIGLYVRLNRHMKEKSRQARQQAQQEIDDDS